MIIFIQEVASICINASVLTPRLLLNTHYRSETLNMPLERHKNASCFTRMVSAV